jgi:hypothetical protein
VVSSSSSSSSFRHGFGSEELIRMQMQMPQQSLRDSDAVRNAIVMVIAMSVLRHFFDDGSQSAYQYSRRIDSSK